jgi:hypothetical protein
LPEELSGFSDGDEQPARTIALAARPASTEIARARRRDRAFMAYSFVNVR